MGCYRCGSPEGNEARLCTACNEKRFSDESNLVEQLAPRLDDIKNAELTKEQKILAGVGSALLVLSLWWILAPAAPIPEPPTQLPVPIAEAVAACLKKLPVGTTNEADIGKCMNIATECLKELEGTSCTTLLGTSARSH